MKCGDTDHDYFKFDEVSIVCRKCGDQRIVDLAALIARLPQPIYVPCPYPHYPQPYVPPTFVWDNTWSASPPLIGGLHHQ